MVCHSVHQHCLSSSALEQCSTELSSKNGCCVGLNPYNPLNLMKLVMNIHIWVKLYTFGRKDRHLGGNKSEICCLEA